MAIAKKTHRPSMAVIPNPKQAIGVTPMQEKFCMIFCTEDITQTDAARKAGFADAATAASKFLNGRDYPQIVERIRQIKEELSVKYEVTFDNHVRKLAEIRDAALQSNNFASAVAAEKARGSAAGLYVTRQEILVGKIDQMSKEEVLAEIRRLQAELPILANATNPTIDITAEEVDDGSGEETLAGSEKDDEPESPVDTP
jgi:phage terminase small subunit